MAKLCPRSFECPLKVNAKAETIISGMITNIEREILIVRITFFAHLWQP